MFHSSSSRPCVTNCARYLAGLTGRNSRSPNRRRVSLDRLLDRCRYGQQPPRLSIHHHIISVIPETRYAKRIVSRGIIRVAVLQALSSVAVSVSNACILQCSGATSIFYTNNPLCGTTSCVDQLANATDLAHGSPPVAKTCVIS